MRCSRIVAIMPRSGPGETGGVKDMAPVLDGLRVLDLSWGVAGYRVWNRGKRSAVFDLIDAGDLERFRRLASAADVLVESFSPGTAAALGIDYDTLTARNPGLVYCSISGYGDDGRDAA